jgi:hypothetical protein
MNMPVNTLVNLPIQNDLYSAASGVSGIGVGDAGEQNMVAALAREAAKANGAQTEFIEATARAGDDPSQLVAALKKVAQFDIDIGLKSSLTRKVVGAVETLIKS